MTDQIDINQVPPEVLEEILMRITSFQHLLSYRLVNKTWKTVSTSVLRQRFTRLCIDTFSRVSGLDPLRETFGFSAEQGTLPWSAIHVPAITNKSLNASLVEVLYQFLDTFGHHLKKVTLIGTSFEISVEVLQRLPHLETAVCKLAPEPSEWETNANFYFQTYSGRINLKSLTYLSIDVSHPSSIQLFRLVLASTGRRSRRLKHVHVGFDAHTEEVAEQVASCLLDVPSISISFRDKSGRYLLPFASKGLKIRILSFYFSRYEPNSSDFNVINQLLTKTSQFLDQLTFECHRHLTAPEYGRMQLPILPVLRRLKLMHAVSAGYYTSQQQPSIVSSFRFFYPLTAIELPVLQEVDIEYTGSCPLFDDSQFRTVKTLRVFHSPTHNPMRTFWNVAFPTLTKLTTAVNPSSLKHIFKHMSHLESLTLDLSSFHEDVNDLLTGLENSDAFLDKSEAEVDDYRTSHKRPSLHSMTRLRRLVLIFQEFNQLRECGIQLALLKIQPLDSLGLGGFVEGIEEYAAKLCSYHIRFDYQKTWNL